MQAREQARSTAARLCAAALVAALLVTPAVAQDAAKKSTGARSTTKKANVMTRDELRACMNEQDRLQAIRTKLDQDTTTLDRQKADVVAMDDDLKKKASALDPADDAARKALEDEAAKRDQAADAYNARLAGLREQGRAYDNGRAAWAQKCASRNYDEMDEAAIRKERAQAARTAKK